MGTKVNVDYDHQVNFTPFQTYTWTASQPQAKNPLMDRRIREDVDAQLSQKGLKKVEPSDNPDLTVFYQAEVTEEYSPNTYGMGAGVGGWGNGTNRHQQDSSGGTGSNLSLHRIVGCSGPAPILSRAFKRRVLT